MREGRPRKFETVEELQDQIDKYFKDCDKEGKPYIIGGLALFLGTSRKVLLDYESKYDFKNMSAKLKSQFSATIIIAKQRIENYNVESLYNKDRPTAGIVFVLKNGFGWKDTTDVNTNITGTVSLTDLSKGKK